MPVSVIGLLNVAIDKEQCKINDFVSLVSREYFEKLNVSLSPDIRFYKTFIVSTGDFLDSSNMDKVPDNKREQSSIFFLCVTNLIVIDFEIIHSDLFVGENFENLIDAAKISSGNVSITNSHMQVWANSFIIEKNVRKLTQKKIVEIVNLYNQVIKLYKDHTESADNINLHWLYAFTKFQECCKISSSKAIINVTSALEFILVNTSDESSYRAAYFTSIICEDTFEERCKLFDFLKWAFSIRGRLSASSPIVSRSFIDKSDIPENVHRLITILAKVLTKTIGLSNKEIQDRITNIIFNGPCYK